MFAALMVSNSPFSEAAASAAFSGAATKAAPVDEVGAGAAAAAGVAVGAGAAVGGAFGEEAQAVRRMRGAKTANRMGSPLAESSRRMATIIASPPYWIKRKNVKSMRVGRRDQSAAGPRGAS